MGSEVRGSSAQGGSLHNMPNGFGRDVFPPDRTGAANSAKDEACRYLRGMRPVIHRTVYPARHRHRSDVPTLPDQIGHNPVLLPDLEVVEL